MNLIRKAITSGLLAFILILTVIFQPVFSQGSFSDNFSGSSINPVWKNSSYQGVRLVQANGVLNGNETSLRSNWEGTLLYKPLDVSVKNVSVDFSYNFPNGKMGDIYLEGRDS